MIDNVLPAGFPVGCADSGSGSPLVLLHCSGADRHIWKKTMDAWSGMADMPPRRILRPELFGCGETAPWPGRAPPRLDDVVDLVCRALSDIAEPIDLVGHSFGGAVALQFTRRMPERVRTLTLLEPTGFFLLRNGGVEEDLLFSQIAKVAQAVTTGAALGTMQGMHAGMACFVDYWNGAGKWQGLSPEMQQSLAQQSKTVAEDFAALFGEPSHLDDYRALTMPVLLINGLQSPQTVQHIAALLERTLPNAERHAFPDAGHMLPLSHAVPIAKLILQRQLLPAGRQVHEFQPAK
jgi:pimeloyl-ACP methyl ester carboxylesterase